MKFVNAEKPHQPGLLGNVVNILPDDNRVTDLSGIIFIVRLRKKSKTIGFHYLFFPIYIRQIPFYHISIGPDY